MKLFNKKQEGLIAMDVGSTSIKLLQLSMPSEGVTQLDGYTIIPVEDGQVSTTIKKPHILATQIKKALQTMGVKNKKVAFSIPSTDATVRSEGVSSELDLAELEAQIVVDIGKYIPSQLNEVFYDYFFTETSILGEVSREVTIVAARRELVDARIELINYADLEPIVASTSSFLLEKAHLVVGAANDAVYVLFNIGHHETNMMIVRNSEAIYTRDLELGGAMLVDSIQAKYNMETPDAIDKIYSILDESEKTELLHPFFDEVLMQIQREIKLYSSTANEMPSRVVISGGVANIPGIAKYLTENSHYAVERFEAFKGIQIGPKVNKSSLAVDAARLLPALSLGLHKAGNEPGLNLMPWRDIEYEKKKNDYLRGAIASVVAGCLVAGVGWGYQKQTLDMNASANNAVRQAIDSTNEHVATLANIDQKRDDIVSRINVIQKLQSERFDLIKSLNYVVQNFPEDAYITKLDKKGKTVTIHGRATNPQVVAVMMRDLRNYPYFSNIVMNSYGAPQTESRRKQPNANNYGSFTVNFTIEQIPSSQAEKEIYLEKHHKKLAQMHELQAATEAKLNSLHPYEADAAEIVEPNTMGTPSDSPVSTQL